MILRNAVRLHTAILAGTSVVLLIAPEPILTAFGISNASFAVLSLTRVLAGLLGVLAAAVYPLPNLPPRVRGKAIISIAASYTLLAALTIMQQVAIWSSSAGMLLSGAFVVSAVAFSLLAINERTVFATGV